jgi:hypothetical protein
MGKVTMRREDALDIINRMPEHDITKMVFVLSVGTSINVESVLRKEKDYIVVRGREAGSNDEGRGFFVPFEQIAMIKIERAMRLNDFRSMYGEALVAGTSLDELAEQAEAKAVANAKAGIDKTPAPISASPSDIAKQNLLERIRAARTSAGSGKPGGK